MEGESRAGCRGLGRVWLGGRELQGLEGRVVVGREWLGPIQSGSREPLTLHMATVSLPHSAGGFLGCQGSKPPEPPALSAPHLTPCAVCPVPVETWPLNFLGRISQQAGFRLKPPVSPGHTGGIGLRVLTAWWTTGLAGTVRCGGEVGVLYSFLRVNSCKNKK